MSRKGKEACNTSSNPKSRADDAWWDMPQVSLLIELMYEHYKKGHLLASTFSEQIWREIGIELSQRNKTQYTVAQLKGKANRLRMLWRKFYDLVYKRTGFGWDPTTCTVTASEDRWAEWIAVNPRESGLKKKGLPHFDLCTEMFSSSVATSSHARSSAMPPISNNDNDDVDVSYSAMDTGNPLSSGPEQIPTATRGRQQKGGQSDRLKRVDKCIDAITACSEAKTQRLANISNDNIENCMTVLSKMEGLPQHLFFAAQDQFVLKVRRQMFLLMSDEDKRAWVETLRK
ncbi:L10-interacting MYB domain-containing protein-like [Sesamum indicum]|uniref:L10-interacting MYB domain-containing protein-like n=1 Tax=Sesamum indicum TaxID=4182 RepID=A0A8M8V081_SESIN|nr:L10-interacting MYB domain-containing protein-like [Sesamum indicum]